MPRTSRSSWPLFIAATVFRLTINSLPVIVAAPLEYAK